MIWTPVDNFLMEPERYELAGLLPGPEWDRRQFFRITGAGVIIALLAGDEVLAQRGGGGGPQDVGAWLHIGEDSIVTVYTGKVEIGQNIRTSLTQAVAEELHAPLASIRMVMADTASVPFDGGTAGSRTTPAMASQLRRAAAAAREALLDLAAEYGKIDRKTLTVAEGLIVGRRCRWLSMEPHREQDSASWRSTARWR
jgi:nicotinate dehydrogenase subunit B